MRQLMTDMKVWLITGAGRGLGVDIVKAVLATGDAVVATGRNTAKVAAAIGVHDNLLAFQLDVTRPHDALAAAKATVAKFGRIDVLVNNAGNSSPASSKSSAPRRSAIRSRLCCSAP